MEISSASQGVSPLLTEKMPKAKDTDRYPRQIGIPFTSPFLNNFIESGFLFVMKPHPNGWGFAYENISYRERDVKLWLDRLSRP
jgi:hypothetical protein